MKDQPAFLKIWAHSIRNELLDDPQSEIGNFVFYTLLHNSLGLSPLAIAIESDNRKEIEKMLQILLFKKGRDYLVYLRKYLFQLLEM